MRKTIGGLLILAATAGAQAQTVTPFASAVGTAVPATASWDLVVNAGLSTATVSVFDLVASYTATSTFRFVGTAFMLPGTPAAGGSGGYTGASYVGSLDGNYGCQLDSGSFTDTGVATYNLGNAGNTTWLSNFNGAPAGTVTPGSFMSVPAQIAERIGNTVAEPAGAVVGRIYGRIRVNANSSGIISADIRLGSSATSRIGKQWRITSIPEPATLSLLVLGGLAGLIRRR